MSHKCEFGEHSNREGDARSFATLLVHGLQAFGVDEKSIGVVLQMLLVYEFGMPDAKIVVATARRSGLGTLKRQSVNARDIPHSIAPWLTRAWKVDNKVYFCSEVATKAHGGVLAPLALRVLRYFRRNRKGGTLSFPILLTCAQQREVSYWERTLLPPHNRG